MAERERFVDRFEILAAIEVDPVVDPIDPPVLGPSINPQKVEKYVVAILGDYGGLPFYHEDIQYDLGISHNTEVKLTQAMLNGEMIVRTADQPAEGDSGGRPIHRFVPTDHLREVVGQVREWNDNVGLHTYMRRRELDTEEDAISELIRLGLMMTDPEENV